MSLNTFAPRSVSASSRQLPKLSPGSSVVVIGAGAFGGWTALMLLKAGVKVTLIDAWGAGNSLSSSGDETRVIRSTYGDNEFYFNLNVRALHLWKVHETQWNKKLFHNTGVLWFCYNEKTPLVDDSIPFSKKHRMEYEYLDASSLRKKFPAVHTDDLHHAWMDPFGGYLMARESCQAVKDAFVRDGGKYIQAHATPGVVRSGIMDGVTVSGERVQADAYVFACGSWLGQLFPKELGSVITCTRQEVYYFGVPKNDSSQYDSMPVWVDVDGKDFYYGIPGNGGRGFKIGVDRRGGNFDPTHGNRIYDPEVLQRARDFISHRFPGLKNAPLVESRVCPYESSPDGNFIFETHPEANNVIFLGGGSGHGFKHGPALGELVAGQMVKKV